MELIYYAVIGLVVGYVIGKFVRAVRIKMTDDEVAVLQKQIDASLFVTVEKHEANGYITYLMFTLVDDKFLMQAPTPSELMQKVRAKFPNKNILIHGDESLSKIPEFTGQFN